MKLVEVKSTNIKAVGWEDNTLYVEYNSGTYKYNNVSKELYEQLLAAESKGRFVCEKIKPYHGYQKVN